MSSAESHREATEHQTLSPAARWVAAAVLGVAGVLGVARGLMSPTSMPIGSGHVATESGSGAAVREAGSTDQGSAAPDGAGSSPASAARSAEGVARKINLNTASAAELDLLPSIGPTLAARIIADREANGPFGSLDDLDRVPGIGPKTVAKLVPYATAE